ncbi:hypothetical protein [Ruminococcus sp. Marseille-P6503]|uniref:hypothetical protein n=1 Tax=Ruminococcus sp. Marseille-P6503 TaxID=2364796 RepID=UPI000F53F681|nr:hypothetical protein [Ruminococcus sp. Marseille-P6503]
MRIKKILAGILCAAVSAAAMTSCDKDESSAINSSTESKNTGVNSALSPVEIKDYSFPEFMEEISVPDMLSNEIYSSFNKEELAKKVEEQPFEEYVCIESYLDTYYVFEEDGFVGIINKHGTVVIEADTYSSAELVSDDLIKLNYPEGSGMSADYLRVSGGYGKLVEDHSFSAEAIAVSAVYDSQEDKELYELTVNGKSVYDKKWDSLDPANIEDIDTAKKASAVYKASSSSQHYFIVFDDYYNIKIYEGVYGMIKLKIGDVYGECYILSGDHYSELEKMIASFGSESAVSRPSKDENLDFIQIVFGLSARDRVQVTISADGYCFTDSLTHNEQPANKYFTVLSRETFIDLVNWVDGTLAQEYE